MRHIEFLEQLEAIIDDRMENRQADSYTVRLLKDGVPKIAQKVGEEAVETALAAALGDNDDLVNESADLLFHLLLLLRARSLRLEDVCRELKHRHAVSPNRN